MYLISKGSLKFANKKFSTIQNDYELTLDANSIVQPCNDPVDIPRMHFKFVPIADIAKCNKDDIVGK